MKAERLIWLKLLEVPTFAIFSPPINKENWNIYEDGKKNISVHLKDYNEVIFNGKPEKQLKKNWQKLYNDFKPEFIFDKLDHFTALNSK